MYVAIHKRIDRIKNTESMILVDPNKYLAIVRTAWAGGQFSFSTHRPATHAEKVAAAVILAEANKKASSLDGSRSTPFAGTRRWTPGQWNERND
jgi:hypothetical protein